MGQVVHVTREWLLLQRAGERRTRQSESRSSDRVVSFQIPASMTLAISVPMSSVLMWSAHIHLAMIWSIFSIRMLMPRLQSSIGGSSEVQLRWPAAGPIDNKGVNNDRSW